MERNQEWVSADSLSHVLTLNQSVSQHILWGKAWLDRPTRTPEANDGRRESGEIVVEEAGDKL